MSGQLQTEGECALRKRTRTDPQQREREAAHLVNTLALLLFFLPVEAFVPQHLCSERLDAQRASQCAGVTGTRGSPDLLDVVFVPNVP
jgi:hypothetical protein